MGKRRNFKKGDLTGRQRVWLNEYAVAIGANKTGGKLPNDELTAALSIACTRGEANRRLRELYDELRSMKTATILAVNDVVKHKYAARKKYKQAHKSTTTVPVDDFLQSYKWRKLRLEALLLHGRKCQCCGATPATGCVLNVDHIKPRKHYPELALSIDNLQVLCHECNHGKGNWNMTDFRT